MSVDKWEQRMLCPDGACVGVIGMNGQCKVCGTAVPNWGDPRKPGRVSSKAEADEPEPEEPEQDDEEEEDEDEEEGDAAEAKDNDAIAKRKLCPDGACVGLIGDDGKCKICGKTAETSDDDEYEDEEEDDEDEEDEEDDDEEEKDEDDEDDKPALPQLDVSKVKTDDDDNRTLCSDGACVGVIGDDGKCKVCGKAAA